MNDLISASSQITMSSLDFLNAVINPARADAGESPLRNTELLRKIEDECDDLGDCSFSATDGGGKPQKIYMLTFDQMLLVGMRESKSVRKSVRDKLKLMDNTQKNQVLQLPNFNNPVEAARAWADEYEQKQIAQEQLKLAAPKIEFVDRFTSRNSLQNATQVAQTMKISAVKMNRILDEIGGVYNQSVKRGRVFCQSWIDDGYGSMIQNEMGYPQAMFTAKGVQKVTEIFITNSLI